MGFNSSNSLEFPLLVRNTMELLPNVREKLNILVTFGSKKGKHILFITDSDDINHCWYHHNQ